jgi:hypothetical protein
MSRYTKFLGCADKAIRQVLTLVDAMSNVFTPWSATPRIAEIQQDPGAGSWRQPPPRSAETLAGVSKLGASVSRKVKNVHPNRRLMVPHRPRFLPPPTALPVPCRPENWQIQLRGRRLWKAGRYETCSIKVIDIKALVIGFLYIILQTVFGQPRQNAEPEEIIVSKETRTISDLVNAISEEMTRLDYKPTVLKQYHIVWNKLCKRAGVRPANDFDMEFGMKFLDEAMRAHPKHLNENSKHRWIKAIYTLADFKRTGILSLRREKRGFVFSELATLGVTQIRP